MSASLDRWIVPKYGNSASGCGASFTSGEDTVRPGELVANKSLQVTFDPSPTFAVAKAGVASNAPELRR